MGTTRTQDRRAELTKGLEASGYLRPVYSADLVGKVLGVSRSKAYELIAAGKIQSIDLGGKIGVNLPALLDYLEGS